MLRALNKNQILILNEIANNEINTITSILTRISKTQKIPLSTLKLNASILKNLNLITFGNSSPAIVTSTGKFVVRILGEQNV